jgi:light-harvesting complex I chlorophyll a/b binding protein 1
MIARTLALVSLLCAASVSAFSVARPAARASASLVSMSAKDMVGSLPPVGFFDPLNLSEGRTPAEMKKFREAELKHGRVSMLAFIGIIVGETINPLFGGQISTSIPAIYQFQKADEILPFFWEIVLFSIALIEGQSILDAWETPKEMTADKRIIANLKEDYINGDLGFDPLSLKPEDSEAFDTMRTKELQNGRLAMLGVAGIVAQELVTNSKIF